MDTQIFQKTRVVFALLGWISVITLQILNWNSAEGRFFMYFTFTIQSNIMVLLWLTLATYWKDLSEKMDPRFQKFKGSVRSALTLYITVTFVIYAFVLSQLFHPTGLALTVDIINHYITPLYFIIDWFFTEHTKISIKNIGLWLSYPVAFLLLALVTGMFTGNYIYFFLDVTEIGIAGLFMWTVILLITFLIFGIVYMGFSNKKQKYFSDRII